MYPLLYQVWVAATDEERQPLVEWWAGRHARSMLGVGFLGAHQYDSTAGGRPPLCNYYEIPGIDVFGEEYHAATLADLPYLDPNGDKYQESALQDLSTTGSTATIYEQIAIAAPHRTDRIGDTSIAVALSTPVLSAFKFTCADRAAGEAWFDATFRAGPPAGCGDFVDVRLTRKHDVQHPISPLPNEVHDWLVLVQWPNRRVGEESHDVVHRLVQQAQTGPHEPVASDLLVNGLALLSGTGWDR